MNVDGSSPAASDLSSGSNAHKNKPEKDAGAQACKSSVTRPKNMLLSIMEQARSGCNKRRRQKPCCLLRYTCFYRFDSYFGARFESTTITSCAHPSTAKERCNRELFYFSSSCLSYAFAAMACSAAFFENQAINGESTFNISEGTLLQGHSSNERVRAGCLLLGDPP